MLDEEALERHVGGTLLALALVAACQVDNRTLTPPMAAAASGADAIEGATGNGATQGTNTAAGGGGSTDSSAASGGSPSGDNTTSSGQDTSSTASSTGGDGNGSVGTGGDGGAPSTEDSSASTTRAASSTGSSPRPLDCSNIDSMGSPLETAPLGATGLYSYGDKVTTMCFESPEPGVYCLYGVGVDSSDGMGNDFAYWGAGIGIDVARIVDGEAIEAWDATSWGVTALRFTVEFIQTGYGVRLQVIRPNEGGLDFEAQGYGNAQGIAGTYDGIENDIVGNGSVTVALTDLRLPPWADVDGDTTTNDQELYPFDPTSVRSIQWQMLTEPGQTTPYDFCISDIAWLDAEGDEVEVTPLPP